jgi:hypothetical protein
MPLTPPVGRRCAGGAEIGVDHGGVAPHRLGRAVGDHPAEVEHHDVVGQAHHRFHVVVDQQHGGAAFGDDAADQRRHLPPFVRVHARHRLVEQQQPRAHHQGARQFHTLLHAIRKAADRPVADRAEVEEIDDLGIDPRGQRRLLAPRRAEPRRCREAVGAQFGVRPELDVLEHRHALEQRDVLEGAGDAAARAAVGGQGEQVVAGEPHRAGRGPVETRDDVEQRRLAGAVGADDGGDPVGYRARRHLRKGRKPAEGERDTLDLQQLARLCRHAAARSLMSVPDPEAAAYPATACGRSMRNAKQLYGR